MGFVGLLLIKPFATGAVCLYKSKRTRLNVNWLRVCLGGKSEREFCSRDVGVERTDTVKMLPNICFTLIPSLLKKMRLKKRKEGL